jgi:serine/threonine protein kinase
LLQLLCDTAEALAFMHGQWFAHLDVKPHNILVQGEASPIHPFVSVFLVGFQ